MKNKKEGKTLMEVFAEEEEKSGEVVRDLAQQMNLKAKAKEADIRGRSDSRKKG